MKTKEIIGSILSFIGISSIGLLTFLGMISITIFLLAYPVQLLWNWLMPIIFGLTEITFWQSLGLIFLSGLLIGRNFSSSNSKKSKKRKVKNNN